MKSLDQSEVVDATLRLRELAAATGESTAKVVYATNGYNADADDNQGDLDSNIPETVAPLAGSSWAIGLSLFAALFVIFMK